MGDFGQVKLVMPNGVVERELYISAYLRRKLEVKTGDHCYRDAFNTIGLDQIS